MEQSSRDYHWTFSSGYYNKRYVFEIDTYDNSCAIFILLYLFIFKIFALFISHLIYIFIFSENYDYLRDLLRPLIPPEYSSTISGWTYQGQLLWEYMEITMDVESLLRGADPRGISSKLESLKQRLSSLPSKINQFPCPTAKHRWTIIFFLLFYNIFFYTIFISLLR